MTDQPFTTCHMNFRSKKNTTSICTFSQLLKSVYGTHVSLNASFTPEEKMRYHLEWNKDNFFPR